jgi:NAD(P)-dependent dehydrogenase (short-subunit alcohol dehydrogenase family)
MGDRLAGKVIVVTGSSGIAAAGARRFAAEGAGVWIIGRDAARGEALVETIRGVGGRAGFASADLRDEAAATAAVAGATDTFGRVDGLLAVAGGSGRPAGDGPLHTIPLEGWTETLALNGTPPFLASREVVRAILAQGSGGSIVLVSSVLATDPVPSLFATHAYAAVKGAEDALARTAAAYYAPHGIRVNVVAPGLVATPMSARAQGDARTSAYVVAKQPLAGGFLPAESIADAALFLLSDEARHITAQRIAVDGGWSVTEAASPPPPEAQEPPPPEAQVPPPAEVV